MWTKLSRAQRIAVAAWIALLALLYGAVTVAARAAVEGERREAERHHWLRMSANEVEDGLTAPEPLAATDRYTPVTVGVYVDNIDALSIRDSFWRATFHVWFRWTGEAELDPAEEFQLVDSRIEGRELVERSSDERGTNFQHARVTARLWKPFNAMRVPLDDHLLTITVEDARRDGTTLRYVADPASNVSSRVSVPGYEVTGLRAVVKNHTYRTQYGDPRADDRAPRTFAQLVVGMPIRRTSAGLPQGVHRPLRRNAPHVGELLHSSGRHLATIFPSDGGLLRRCRERLPRQLNGPDRRAVRAR
jgi:hypothetical protein